MHESLWVWGLFGALVLALLALDWGALRRSEGEQSFKSAILWSATRIGLAVAVSPAFSLLMIPAEPSPQKLEKA